MKRTLVLFLFFSQSLFAQVNLKQGLIAYYPFNGNANDASGNGLDGIARNGIQLTTDKFGNSNSAYYFDGVDDYIEVLDDPKLRFRDSFSICLLFNRDPTGNSTAELIEKRLWSDGSASSFDFGLVNAAQVRTAVKVGDNCPDPLSGWIYPTVSNTTNTNQWYCVVTTFDQGLVNFYLDGSLVGTGTTSPRIDSCVGSSMRIGIHLSFDLLPFKGKIDEVRVYDRAINQQEVTALCDLCDQPNDFDFNYKTDQCDPLTAQFAGIGSDTLNPWWSFGDGKTLAGNLNPSHSFAATGSYTIRYAVGTGTCTDTVTKMISLAVIPDDIILTSDTIICSGTVAQIKTTPVLGFCWNPTTYLDNPQSANPVTRAPQNMTYFFTAQVAGQNLITNGDFNNQNSGFTSDYQYANVNSTEGEYFVGKNPSAWNGALSSCKDHTTTDGNMLLVNGSPVLNQIVWKQTIAVLPNTNYAFSTWIQSLISPNPSQLQFSINGKNLGNLIYASLPPCTWRQFYTTWNSGNSTTATISIVNRNIIREGNDFALDDISFAPVFTKQDSVVISVVSLPTVTAKASGDVDCTIGQSQLNATGAVQYEWSPSITLNNFRIANPIARPTATTVYTVKGTDANGCANYDSVMVRISDANKSSYFMASAFTPNNDGLNDCYGLKYWGVIQELDFAIYNRWGQRIFQTTTPGDCWDGTYKGVKQDPGVFVYLINAKTLCGNVFRKGTFALIR